ncbi:TPA: hypothetical protein ACKQAS_000910, partial [Stenotrophomonas maltophilia]
MDQGQATQIAVKQVHESCNQSAPAAGTHIQGEIKLIVGWGSVNASGSCFFGDGRYQGWYSKTVAFDTECKNRPDYNGAFP